MVYAELIAFTASDAYRADPAAAIVGVKAVFNGKPGLLS